MSKLPLATRKVLGLLHPVENEDQWEHLSDAELQDFYWEYATKLWALSIEIYRAKFLDIKVALQVNQDQMEAQLKKFKRYMDSRQQLTANSSVQP